MDLSGLASNRAISSKMSSTIAIPPTNSGYHSVSCSISPPSVDFTLPMTHFHQYSPPQSSVHYHHIDSSSGFEPLDQCWNQMDTMQSLSPNLELPVKSEIHIENDTESCAAVEMDANNGNPPTGKAAHRCPFCSKTFGSTSYLTQHLRIHSQVRPFGPCEYCGKKFTQLSHLQQHTRTHTGEKPYKCKECGKGFTQLSNLQNHSRSHASDKTFKCNSCYKCFDKEKDLLAHIPSHTRSKHLRIHVCKYCGKSYALLTYLIKHMSKHAEHQPKDVADSKKVLLQENEITSTTSDSSSAIDGAKKAVANSGSHQGTEGARIRGCGDGTKSVMNVDTSMTQTNTYQPNLLQPCKYSVPSTKLPPTYPTSFPANSHYQKFYVMESPPYGMFKQQADCSYISYFCYDSMKMDPGALIASSSCADMRQQPTTFDIQYNGGHSEMDIRRCQRPNYYS